MLITVRYYAILRDMTGVTVEEMTVPHDCHGDELINHIVERHPGVAEFAPFLRLANDREYISAATTLTEKETISVIPPVSGG